MKSWKKLALLATLTLAGTSILAACGSSSDSSESGSRITVVSREDGSGTRSAFVELFEVEEDDVDNTTSSAIVTNSTSVTRTTVSGDEAAIGYVSLGSLDDSVKAVSIDGAEATSENIASGDYTISRPFNIVTKDGLSDAAQDFINFILSDEGQAVVKEAGYIPVETSGAYSASVTSGKVVVSGSSSVSPVMEKLKEAYLKANSGMEVEIQQSGSSTGITNAIDGTADIGMASRELKNEETSEGVSSTVIANDGIAVIVNEGNEVSDLTKHQVKQIFAGEITTWDEVSE